MQGLAIIILVGLGLLLVGAFVRALARDAWYNRYEIVKEWSTLFAMLSILAIIICLVIYASGNGRTEVNYAIAIAIAVLIVSTLLEKWSRS